MLLYNEIYVGERIGEFIEPHSGGLLFHLMQHEDFQRIVKEFHYQVISPCCHELLSKGTLDSLVMVLEDEANRDEQLYRIRRIADYRTATRNTIDFLRRRLEFLDWYFKVSSDDVICVSYQTKTKMMPHERKIKIYYPIGKPVYAPLSLRPYASSHVYNHDPIPTLYIEGTDSIISDGTVFYSPRKLEIRNREPIWREVQMRRIYKKLQKWNVIASQNNY